MSKMLDASSLSEKHIETLAKLLYQKARNEEKEKQYASAKTVLSLLGMGVAIAAAFIAPRATSIIGNLVWEKDTEWDNWKRFNKSYLRQTLRRLEKQKLVEIKEVGGKQKIIITQAGKRKILEYSIDELEIVKPNRWDKKWRIVIYDIPKRKKPLQELVREILKNLGFYPMQESVYIIPYPCYKEIEFLRTYYNLSPFIKYLLVEKLEDDSVYKTYFGL